MNKEALLNQQVLYLKENVILTVVSVNNATKFEDLKLTFDNGKTFLLVLAMKNNIIKFVDEKIQKEVLDALNGHQKKQEERAIEVEKNHRIAIEANKKKLEEEINNPPVSKKRGRKSKK